MKKILSLIVLCAISLAPVSMTTGCQKKPVVVNAPAGVDTKAVAAWYQATGAMLSVSEGAKAGPRVIATLYSNGAVDDQYKTDALNLMKDFDNGCLHITAILNTSPNNFNASMKAQIFALTQSMLSELQKFNAQGGTHIKNPNSVAEFNTLLSSISLGVTMTQQLTQGGN